MVLELGLAGSGMLRSAALHSPGLLMPVISRPRGGPPADKRLMTREALRRRTQTVLWCDVYTIVTP